jgi:hypothetical protein
MEELQSYFQEEESRKDEFHKHEAIYSQKLLQWIGHPQKNHVRVLLCTLPEVLWEGHSWQRVSMADLETVDQVKSCYRKYIVRFHPDRVLNGGDQTQIYLSNRVFAAMTDAFTLFKKEHNLK